jgi:hypothetical protein
MDVSLINVTESLLDYVKCETRPLKYKWTLKISSEQTDTGDDMFLQAFQSSLANYHSINAIKYPKIVSACTTGPYKAPVPRNSVSPYSYNRHFIFTAFV